MAGPGAGLLGVRFKRSQRTPANADDKPMTRSSSDQYKFRKAVFKANVQSIDGVPTLICYKCGCHIKPGAGEKWEADHKVPLAFGGSEGAVICIPCHKHKTAKDVPAIAKSVRVREKHLGIRRKGWSSKFRKKMSGEVVER
jgi:5-methylcytosine-specific restriction endonuclease McrA